MWRRRRKRRGASSEIVEIDRRMRWDIQISNTSWFFRELKLPCSFCGLINDCCLNCHLLNQYSHHHRACAGLLLLGFLLLKTTSSEPRTNSCSQNGIQNDIPIREKRSVFDIIPVRVKFSDKRSFGWETKKRSTFKKEILQELIENIFNNPAGKTKSRHNDYKMSTTLRDATTKTLVSSSNTTTTTSTTTTTTTTSAQTRNWWPSILLPCLPSLSTLSLCFAALYVLYKRKAKSRS